MEVSYFAIGRQLISPSRFFPPFYSHLTFYLVLCSFYSQKINFFPPQIGL